MLAHPVLQPDRKKACRKARRLRHIPCVPRYAGRWPFIRVASPLESRDENGALPKTPNRVYLDVHAAHDGVIHAIQRSPLTAVAIATGVGFALALAFVERDG